MGCRSTPISPQAHRLLQLTSSTTFDNNSACYQTALALKPGYAEAHINLGSVLQSRGNLDEAVACYRQALSLKPGYAEAHSNLGGALKDQGLLEEAVVCYQQALALKPGSAVTHSNLVYTLYFCPDYDASMIHDAHRLWNQQHALPLATHIRPHNNDRTPHRRLRIGYVSPNFHAHPVGLFVLPLLESHNHEDFEIVCYSSVEVQDQFTSRFCSHADTWRKVLGFSDEQVANTVRQDRIDILVDLTLHMNKNRLLVFARRPAPVQVTYLGYCGTTGMSAMDYRLTDPYLDPPNQTGEFYSEQSIWLPETYWCYRPMLTAPDVNALPALRNGYFTFGCLNNFGKVTVPTLEAWCRLLKTMPQSRLLLHAKIGSHRDRVRDFFSEQGISPERLLFAEMVPTSEYFQLYGKVDVALDPFPYNGGTTTFDAMWMGVPVVSLAGQTSVGRAGLSILSNVGLEALVARDVDEYVLIARDLANDLPRLAQLRECLRQRMEVSPLMDSPRFARNIEAAYRRMWQQWCDQR